MPVRCGLASTRYCVMDERHDFFEQKFCVAIGAAAAEFWGFGGRVFGDAGFAGVVDADDDQRLDFAVLRSRSAAP